MTELWCCVAAQYDVELVQHIEALVGHQLIEHVMDEAQVRAAPFLFWQILLLVLQAAASQHPWQLPNCSSPAPWLAWVKVAAGAHYVCISGLTDMGACHSFRSPQSCR